MTASELGAMLAGYIAGQAVIGVVLYLAFLVGSVKDGN